LSSDLTEDGLLGGRVRLTQPAKGYRVGIEPVLLAAAIDAPPGARILDLGCGAGAASLCLLARRPDLQVTGIEADADAAELARGNAARNDATERFRVIEHDLLFAPRGAQRFAVAMSNPPFHEGRSTDPSPHPAKARATVEADLVGWVDAAIRLLEPRGRLAMIYRADRLDALLASLTPRFGAIGILPLWPRDGVAARRVIVRAVLGSRASLTLHPGLVLHGAGNSYTQAVAAILRDAAPLLF
jgi:tRNA1(Val) A37 N6-methylase TrmN6